MIKHLLVCFCIATTAHGALRELAESLKALGEMSATIVTDAQLEGSIRQALADDDMYPLDTYAPYFEQQPRLERAHRLVNLLLANELFKTSKTRFGEGNEVLEWHSTTDSATRIMLALRITDDLAKKYQKNDLINIVSIGSGQLLEEYLLIHSLRAAGFERIVINCIDPEYGSFPHINPYINRYRGFLTKANIGANITAQEIFSKQNKLGPMPTEQVPVIVIPWGTTDAYLSCVDRFADFPRTSAAFLVSGGAETPVFGIAPNTMEKLQMDQFKTKLGTDYASIILRSTRDTVPTAPQYRIYKTHKPNDFFIAARNPVQKLITEFGTCGTDARLNECINRIVVAKKDDFPLITLSAAADFDFLQCLYYTGNEKKGFFGYRAIGTAIEELTFTHSVPLWKHVSTHILKGEYDTLFAWDPEQRMLIKKN